MCNCCIYVNFGQNLSSEDGANQGAIEASLFPNIFDKGNALLNAGSTFIGAGEIGLKFLRSNSGFPRGLARIATALSGEFVGTQRANEFLRASATQMSKSGRYLGNIGILVSSVDYIANFKEKSGYDHLSYWTGMGFPLLAQLFQS
jgi:hypothetical protein